MTDSAVTTRSRRPRKPYHHGALRQAMIDAAVQIVEESGAENVTIREAARRAGVSSGAPYRHFATRTALMTGVAEDAMIRLRASIERTLAACASNHPLVRLAAIGEGYIDWAVKHPTHYRVCGDRTQIDFWTSDILVRDNGWIRGEMAALFEAAQRANLVRAGDIALIHFQSRALAYGLARMYVDGHLREFGISKTKARDAMRAALIDFIASLARDPPAFRSALAKA